MKFNSTSSALIVASVLTFVLLYFVGLAAPGLHDLIKFGYEICFLALFIGVILKKKNIQQLIGLFLYIVFYNLAVLKRPPFQIQNENVVYLINHYSFFIIVAAIIFIIPTTFDKYHFKPLTNPSNLKDSTVILTTVILTIAMQTLVRLLV
jgi:hypothetical protein